MFVTAAYSYFWRGWLLVHALLSVSLFVTGFFCFLKKPLKIQNFRAGAPLLAYLLSPLALIPVFWGLGGLKGFVTEGVQLVREFYTPAISVWPDIFLTVGELEHSGFREFSRSLGGNIFLLVAAAGPIIAIAAGHKKNTAVAPAVVFLLSFLSLTTFLGSGIGRFALLAVAPAAFGFALTFDHAASALETVLRKFFDAATRHKDGVLTPAMGTWCLAAALLLGIIYQAHVTARFEHPIYNASWDKMMKTIRTQTPEDSIVTTWWSPGHFITGVAKRRVTFDGATQNTPQAYWVADLFMEASEQKALSVLRMLSLSGNNACEFLLRHGFKTSEAVALLHEILPLSREAAAQQLKGRLEVDDRDHLLDLTHGRQPPPPCYLFLYDDMITQILALEFTSDWNFQKVEQFQEYYKKNPGSVPKKMLKHGSEDYARLLWGFSAKPVFQDREAYQQRVAGPTLFFNNGLSVNLDTFDAELKSEKLGSGKPKNLYLVRNGRFEKIPLRNATLDVSVLLIEDARGSYRSVLAGERLIESLAFRLFYLKGAGLESLKLLAEEENINTRNRFYVFRVDWKEFLKETS
jgi:dolichyl-diphosphooligosaccharide--protein glycosyltransferase